jgi:hypothetical protein
MRVHARLTERTRNAATVQPSVERLLAPVHRLQRSGAMTRERRRTYRATVDLEAMWRRGPRCVPARIRELNAHGVSFVVREAPDVNYLISVDVVLPERTATLMLVTRSVRIVDTHFVIGAEIHSMASDEQALWLQRYRAIAGMVPATRSEVIQPVRSYAA